MYVQVLSVQSYSGVLYGCVWCRLVNSVCSGERRPSCGGSKMARSTRQWCGGEGVWGRGGEW